MIRRCALAAPRIAIPVLVSALLFLSSCSLPRIIILHDPLTPEEHDNLGRIYESQGKPDLALEQYREALQENKKHLPTLLLLGDLSYQTGKYPDAESAYQKVIDLDAKNAGAMNNLAWVYIKTGKNLDKAKELAGAALQLEPGRRPFYLDTLGVVLLKQGDAAGAVKVLQESVDTLPKDQQELLTEAQGHLAEAHKAAEKAEKTGGKAE